MSGTLLNPIALAALLLTLVLFFVLPRRFAIVPLLAMFFLVPEAQQLYVGGVHLFLDRIVVLAGFIRMATSRPPRQRSLLAGGWTPIDTVFVSYVLVLAVATLLLFGSVPALINQVGLVWDYALGFLLLRGLIQDERDTILAIKTLAVLMGVLAACMLFEEVKMFNPFGLLGGVPLVPEFRDGKVRAQGPFAHSLTAGAFAAASIPLFVLLWKVGKSKLWGAIGIIGASVCTVATQTSTSLLTWAAAVFAICMWPLRRKMKSVRIGMVVGLVGLQLVMKAPVWFLIARVDLTGSSSSYHRAELIDQCVNHFSSWWLMGVKDTSSWGWDMWDAQDMFVATAETGGLVGLILFIMVISRSFGRLGRARKRAESKNREWALWLLGSALFANVVSFFGVNYFDQVRMAYFALISMICAFSAPILIMKKNEKASIVTTVRISSEVHAAGAGPVNVTEVGSVKGRIRWP